MELDKKALIRWEKANISYKNYQDFLNRKEDRFLLTIFDLLYISNFKGGNSTINEPEQKINKKLKSYSNQLRVIQNYFNNKNLDQLDKEEINLLSKIVLETCQLTNNNSPFKIDGFGVSYLSALLNSFFPNLIPILDRRVLINLDLVKNENLTSQKQVKNIVSFYSPLIKKIAEHCKTKRLTIRELDKEFFTQSLSFLK